MSSNLSDSLIAGSLSGGITRLITAPLDVLKIRLQLQLEPIKFKSGSKYSGMLNATKTIFKEEGVLAFWKGFVPGEGLYIVYGATQFVTYEGSKNFLQRLLPTYSASYTSGVNFISGSAGGTAATLLSFPLDVLRTRMIGQGEPKVYRNVFHAMEMMYRENGIRTFYRGLSPALVSVVPQTGFVFTSYGIFNCLWDLLLGERLGGLQYLVCGALAGIVPKLMLMPLDLPKKRLEVQGFERARAQFGHVGRYQSLLHCLYTVYRDEGLRGFYKGAVPTIIKAAVTVSLSFTVYEHTHNLLRKVTLTT